MFRLLGGGVPGDLAPMPRTQFAVLPGTSHIGVTGRADMLMTMIRPSWTYRELPLPARPGPGRFVGSALTAAVLLPAGNKAGKGNRWHAGAIPHAGQLHKI
jgi:hypothetical protein